MTEKLLNSGFLYFPQFRKDFTPKPGQCRASVHNGGGSFGSHQCTRKAKVTREVEYHGKPAMVEYCGLHDPVAVKAKSDARHAKWRAEWDAKSRATEERKRLEALGAAAIDALKQIAAGHNDARGLAQEVLRGAGEC